MSAMIADEFISQNYLFRKNILSGKVEFKTLNSEEDFKVFTKESMNTLAHQVKMNGQECSKIDLEEVIFSEATPLHNPIGEYMDKLPAWDGIDRVTSLWQRLGSIDDERVEFLHIWHRSCVAHWLQLDPLHGNECVPTLIGDQGCGKTTFAKRLLPEELRKYFLDHINLSNKFDKEMALTNNLLVNLDELDSIRPSQQAMLKQTLSKSKVNGRPIYGGSQEDRARFASFIATTNNQHPLQDVTGSRRNICIKIAEGVLVENDSEIDYQQLYAQLKHEVMVEKKAYWFNNEQVKRIQELNMPFVKIMDLEQMLATCFRKPKQGEQGRLLSISEIMRTICVKFPHITPSQSNAIVLGRMLNELGYKQHRSNSLRTYDIVPRQAA